MFEEVKIIAGTGKQKSEIAITGDPSSRSDGLTIHSSSDTGRVKLSISKPDSYKNSFLGDEYVNRVGSIEIGVDTLIELLTVATRNKSTRLNFVQVTKLLKAISLAASRGV